MAKGRTLTKQIANSKALWDMGAEHVLLWCCILPHLDRDGRFTAEPAVVRGRCVPYSPFTDEQVEQILFDFSRLPDVQLYENEFGDRFIQFDNFRNHQPGFRPGQKQYEREPRSQCPHPSECHPVVRTSTRDMPSLERVTDTDEEPF